MSDLWNLTEPQRRQLREAHAAEKTAAVPECATPGHGPMEPRDLTAQTYEQMWCGVWYDCTHPQCRSSVLIKSPELAQVEDD